MPQAYKCIKQYQSTPPPFVDRDRFLAVSNRISPNLPKCEKYLVQRVLDYLRFVPLSRSEILESIPTILKSS